MTVNNSLLGATTDLKMMQFFNPYWPSLELLSMEMKTTFSDVNIICGTSDAVPSNKLILGQLSPLLYHFFMDTLQCEHATVIIPDADKELINLLVLFITSGSIECNQMQKDYVVDLMHLLSIHQFEVVESSHHLDQDDCENSVDYNSFPFLLFNEESDQCEAGSCPSTELLLQVESKDNIPDIIYYLPEKKSEPKYDDDLCLNTTSNEEPSPPCPTDNHHHIGDDASANPQVDIASEGSTKSLSLNIQIQEKAAHVREVTESSPPGGKRKRKNYKCEICSKTFHRSKVHFTRHMVRHSSEKPFSCSKCNKSFFVESSLEAHLRNAHKRLVPDSDGPFECTTCKKSFPRKVRFSKHLLTHCNEFKCELCGKVLRHRWSLASHMLLHTGERPYSCDLCGKTFVQECNYKIHLRVHSGEKPYKCEVCNKLFGCKSNLNNHTILHHTKKFRHYCGSCNQGFVMPSEMKQHEVACAIRKQLMEIEADVSDPLVVDECNVPTFSCKLCPSVFSSKEYLKSHMRNHALNVGSYSCPHCSFVTNRRTGLNAHMIRHSEVRPYLCTICGAGFKAKYILDRHVKRLHTENELRLNCTICEQVLSSRISLTKHMKTHSAVKPYICKVCKKTFHTNCELQDHQLLHLDLKPFECPTCFARFRQKAHVKDHIITNHTKAYPICCEICGQGFLQASRYKRHQLKCTF